jgi:hypothetical protein
MNVGDTIWYMNEGRVHSAPILAKMIVENKHEEWACTEQQKGLFTPFGKTRTVYATCHGQFEQVYPSKPALLESL